MSKLVIIGCSVLFLFAILVKRCESNPYQFLPMREGYVPVYIRMGETPLNEINPELAIAFHEIGANGRQLKSNEEFDHPPSEKVAIAVKHIEEPKIEKIIDVEPVEAQPFEHKFQFFTSN